MASNLHDRIKHVFSDRQQRVQEALSQSSEERGMLYEAAATLSRTEQELQRAQNELDGLPVKLASADLEGDEDGMAAIRSRHAELKEIISGLEAEREQARKTLQRRDPRTAEQLSLGRAQSVASEEVRTARKERDQLVKALDEALAELETEASEATALGLVYSDKEAS